MHNNDSKRNGRGRDKEFQIIVNGRPKTVKEKFLFFVDVVKLAFGEFKECSNQIYTMTFKKGRKEGSLVFGDEIRIKEGVIFNVTATNKS